MSERDPMHTDLLRETELFLHAQIPLTRAMGVQVESFDGERLTLTAPLEPNHNHLGTAFGGSLSALAVLAGYALLWLLLEDRGCHIVVRESSIRYRRPVTGTLRAICARPDDATLAAFRKGLSRTGKSTVQLRVVIEDAGQICVEFEGDYVALTQPAEKKPS